MLQLAVLCAAADMAANCSAVGIDQQLTGEKYPVGQLHMAVGGADSGLRPPELGPLMWPGALHGDAASMAGGVLCNRDLDWPATRGVTNNPLSSTGSAAW